MSIQLVENILSNHFLESSSTIKSINDNISSIEKSEILLTDNSSIISEFIFALKRPIIKINYIDKIHNEFYKDLNLNTFDDIIVKTFGNTIDIKDLQYLPEMMNKILNSKLDYEKVNEFLKNNISNLGSSSKVAAKILHEEF